MRDDPKLSMLLEREPAELPQRGGELEQHRSPAELGLWVVLWYRAARAFQIDSRQVLRGNTPWASKIPSSMRADWHGPGRWKRAARLLRLSEHARFRAIEQLVKLEPDLRELVAVLLLELEQLDVDTELLVWAERVPVLVRRETLHRIGENVAELEDAGVWECSQGCPGEYNGDRTPLEQTIVDGGDCPHCGERLVRTYMTPAELGRGPLATPGEIPGMEKRP